MATAKTPEGQVKKEVMEVLHGLGGVVEPLHTGFGMGKGGRWRTPDSSRGRADIIVLWNSLVIAIEVKTKEKDSRQSASQKEWQERWEKNGGLYWVVKSKWEVLGLVSDLVLP